MNKTWFEIMSGLINCRYKWLHHWLQPLNISLLLLLTTGCQTVADLKLNSEFFNSTESDVRNLKSKNSFAANTLSDQEVCALIFVEGQNQQTFELEAIRRNLTCKKSLDAKEIITLDADGAESASNGTAN